MAAYGALVSVMQIIDQLHRHPHPPISLRKEHVESLTANLTFLQKFLEGYNPHRIYTSEADPLESRIAKAAYAAEDVIENYIVDQIQARSTDHDGGNISSTQFHQGLEKVIQEMDLIKMEIVEKKMKEGVQIIKNQSSTGDVADSSRSSSTAKKVTTMVGLDDALYEMLDKITGGEHARQIKMEIVEKEMKEGVEFIKNQSTTDDAADSSRPSSTAQKATTMVGLDDVLYEMLDKITGGERGRQIIPIVGMGGLGKTTLARNIYAHQLVKEHFDIRAWATISQVHNAQKILTEILGQLGIDNRGDLSDGELGVKLYQHLIGRRYLIVMDDMWSIEAWDAVRSFFPDNENGSRVVVTTRLSNLALLFNYSDGLDMKFMDEATSWELFCKTVFGEETCPLEVEDIGKKIVEGCRGLPLSIAVVGGLLSKLEATRENWQVIEENLSSVVNSEGDRSCLQTLYVSYNNLPIHLKPCFLYYGVFSEDEEILVIMLIGQWVAEGFVKPIEGKSLEEAAQEYLQELVDRNLVLVERRDSCGDVETIKIHDLLRDLALREGEKDKFLCALEQSSGDKEIGGQRRISSNLFKEENSSSSTFLVEAAATVRTLIGEFGAQILPISRFRLLRVLYMGLVEEESSSDDEYYEEILVRLLNLRFLLVDVDNLLSRVISSHLWNLQALFICNINFEQYVAEIWKMPLLRHVSTDGEFCLSDPPPDDQVIVLENLHTLYEVRNLKFSEEVLKRIPNIIVLYVRYIQEGEEEEEEKKKKNEGDYYCLNNLHRLNKLQYLRLNFRNVWDSPPVQELVLPYSLKQLTLSNTKLPWEEMASKIGCLPLLQVLILESDAFVGSEWETVEGQFSCLTYLKIEECCDLEHWTTDDSTHFPRLEQLVLRLLTKLREIPSSIGDIPTLRSIELECCSDSAEESARRIRDEQEEYGNEVLQIQVKKQPYIIELAKL